MTGDRFGGRFQMKAKLRPVLPLNHASIFVNMSSRKWAGFLRCFTSHKWDSLTKEDANMTAFETVSIVLGIITLIIASISLLLKLFIYLDSRHK